MVPLADTAAEWKLADSEEQETRVELHSLDKEIKALEKERVESQAAVDAARARHSEARRHVDSLGRAKDVRADINRVKAEREAQRCVHSRQGSSVCRGHVMMIMMMVMVAGRGAAGCWPVAASRST